MKWLKLILSIIFLLILYYFYTLLRLHEKYVRTKCIDLKIIVDNLQTGDLIMTSRTGMHNLSPCTLFGIDFIHILMVVKINGRKFFLHFVKKDYIPGGVSIFNNDHIQLIDCEEYFNKYQIYQPVYKLYKYVGEELDIDNIFQIVEKYKYKKFSILDSYRSKNVEYSCCTLFMAKILSGLRIIDETDVIVCFFPNLFDKKLKDSIYYKTFLNFRV